MVLTLSVVSQLSAHYSNISIIPRIFTHCTPCSSNADLHSALIYKVSSHQSQLTSCTWSYIDEQYILWGYTDGSVWTLDYILASAYLCIFVQNCTMNSFSTFELTMRAVCHYIGTPVDYLDICVTSCIWGSTYYIGLVFLCNPFSLLVSTLYLN